VEPVRHGRLTIVRVRAATLAIFAGVAALLLWRCPIAWLAHIPCPGCGTTRACILLTRGQLRASLAMQPMALPLMVAVVAVLVVESAQRRGPHERDVSSRAKRWTETLACVVGLIAIALRIARFFGAFGGPVAID
jgi:Protein of unknown function (DUF2752)